MGAGGGASSSESTVVVERLTGVPCGETLLPAALLEEAWEPTDEVFEVVRARPLPLASALDDSLSESGARCGIAMGAEPPGVESYRSLLPATAARTSA